MLPKGVWDQAIAKLRIVENDMGRSFGDAMDPLLLSVRSGAAISMPGMLDTVLNLGLNDVTAAALERQFGTPFPLLCSPVLSSRRIYFILVDYSSTTALLVLPHIPHFTPHTAFLPSPSIRINDPTR